VLWKRGGTMNSVFRGRIDCADLAIAPKITGEAQMVVPCTGDRIFGQVQDHEVAFSFPDSMIDEVVEGHRGKRRVATLLTVKVALERSIRRDALQES
jgi:uncharacterized protein (DUF169 family)